MGSQRFSGLPAQSNDLNSDGVDETVFISDDEDSIQEIAFVNKKKNVGEKDVDTLRKMFGESFGGIGSSYYSVSEGEDEKDEIPIKKAPSVIRKQAEVAPKNTIDSNKYKYDDFNNKTKGMTSTKGGDDKYGHKLNNKYDVNEAIKSLKRRSPPPTFNTPDRPKEKPMSAFRKMQRTGPMICSPQPLIEGPTKPPLRDKKNVKDVVLGGMPSYVPKNTKTMDGILSEIQAIGSVIILNGATVDSIVTTSKAKRLIGGLMNENRMNTITVKLADLFKTLLHFKENFDKKKRLETPKHFVKELNDYQKKGLAFLVEREKTYPCGGILADDMGLGKTAQMISLLVYQKNNALANQELELIRIKKARENSLIPIKTTLVITPLSLMSQWESEVKKFTSNGFLTVYQFHGPKRTTDPHVLGQYDIVISSYNTIASEYASIVDDEDDEDGKRYKKSNEIKKPTRGKVSKGSVLERVSFQRIILDEAHVIKNRKSKVSRACNSLSSLNRWCVTGTPVHNEMMDAFSLYRFLRCYPIDQEAMWKQYMSSGTVDGPFRLQTLVQATLLRRTKDETSEESGEKLVKLPKKHIKRVELEMMPSERLIYDQMFKAAQMFVKNFLDEVTGKDGGNSNYGSKNPFLNAKLDDYDGQFKKMACILVYLLRLRQACNHFYLTKAGLDLDCFDAFDEKSAKIMKDDISMSESLDESIMNSSGCNNNKHLEVFSDKFMSSKVKALFDRLNKVLKETNDKVIIISQWTSMFTLIQKHLNAKGISFVEIKGEISQEERRKAQDAINSTNNSVRIMFLSLKAGGVGLNLVGANHIFMLDLHWNPFNEDQACDRIYRIGQNKEVFIHKFVCKNTVENRVLELQDRKRELSKEFLGETKVKRANHLNNDDLAFIFDC